MKVEVNGQEIATTDTGFLTNIVDWTEEVASVIAQSNHNIESVNYTGTHEAGHNMMVFIISVKSLNSLNKHIDKLNKIKNVYRVERKRS